MARTTGDTMAEGLQKQLSQLGALMALPDADMNFLQGVQSAIATYLQQGAMGATQGGNINLPPGPGAPGPANATNQGMPPMGGMQGPAAGGPGIPPMMQGPGVGGIQPPPNMDELRRVLGPRGIA